MQQKKLLWTAFLFLAISFLFYTIGFSEAVEAQAYPEEWAWGERLLIGLLILIVVGWLTGAYALLFTSAGPVIKRFLLYPLFKIKEPDGEKKPLITKK